MKKKLKRLAAVGMAGIMVWSLTACKSAKTVTKETEPLAAKAEENLLNVHIDVEVASMDPQIATDGTSFEVIAGITDGLYGVDAGGKPVPALAESVDKSSDGLTLTYHLRDAIWSNGTPVTANDFVFAWRRAVDPDTASEYAYSLLPMTYPW
ncbi:ABC transporter substrate-binding protein [Lacrimispora sp. JR3]|uniref:ABC transporter substrate-binding protein n=1 Tax=Lacrimispora sinapis TaxID=3111456 RepID=UPI003749FB5D